MKKQTVTQLMLALLSCVVTHEMVARQIVALGPTEPTAPAYEMHAKKMNSIALQIGSIEKARRESSRVGYAIIGGALAVAGACGFLLVVVVGA